MQQPTPRLRRAAGVALDFAARALPISQLLGGALLLSRPAPLARAVSGAASDIPPLWLVRLLGLRLMAQGAAAAASSRPVVAAVSAAVDATHGATMAFTALIEPRFRRLAVTSGAVAVISATISARAAAANGRGR